MDGRGANLGPASPHLPSGSAGEASNPGQDLSGQLSGQLGYASSWGMCEPNLRASALQASLAIFLRKAFSPSPDKNANNSRSLRGDYCSNACHPQATPVTLTPLLLEHFTLGLLNTQFQCWTQNVHAGTWNS